MCFDFKFLSKNIYIFSYIFIIIGAFALFLGLLLVLFSDAGEY